MWAGIAAFDAATEFFIVALPVALVWSLQMGLRQKSQVVLAFLFRLGYVYREESHDLTNVEYAN